MKIRSIVQGLLILSLGIGVGFIWGHEVGWVQSRNNVCAMINLSKPGVVSDMPNICPRFTNEKE